MRLLLDAHISGRRIGERLREHGHDVRALDQEPAFENLADRDVLALAAHEGRILLTLDVADFPAILREWAASGRSHAGVIVVHGIGNHEFALLTRGVQRWLELRPVPADWTDFPATLDRSFSSR